MLEGIQTLIALAAIVGVTVVAAILLDELTEIPDRIRNGVRGHAARRSLASRIEKLEERLAAAERKLERPAA